MEKEEDRSQAENENNPDSPALRLRFTNSADDILDVTPVNSKDAGDNGIEVVRSSSTYDDDGDDEWDDDESNVTDTNLKNQQHLKGNEYNEEMSSIEVSYDYEKTTDDGFGGSYTGGDDQSDADSSMYSGLDLSFTQSSVSTPRITIVDQSPKMEQPKNPQGSNNNTAKAKSPESEWDRALQSGKPSTGRAAFSRNSVAAAKNANRYRYGTAAVRTGSLQNLDLHTVPEEDNKGASVSNSSASRTPNTGKDPNGKPQPELSSPARSRPSGKPPPPPPPPSSVASSASNYPSSPHRFTNTKAGNHALHQRRLSIGSVASSSSGTSGVAPPSTAGVSSVSQNFHHHHSSESDRLSAGVLPDVLMTMRQKIESLTLFDSDIMRIAADQVADDVDPESRESLKKSSQQALSAAVLVSLAHKRYERRRLAAMEIEKVVRSLVVQYQQVKQQQNAANNPSTLMNGVNKPTASPEVALERVRAILLLLSDDYVRSTSEDARKGGVVALAACAIGLKKADDSSPTVQECRDLILASVVHACQDHSQRVRYYATESLFNVVKVIPSLAVQHFFILFEILRSLYADVDADVRSGAELLDKKLKEVIVGAMNAGIFTADACVPVFSRFVFMRHKATKRLTLTWLQELNEKLIGAPILEFLHLFLGGIFDMVADPTIAIRQSALAFLQSVLPKLLVVNSEAIDDMDDQGMKVDFDKILQSLVTTMEHANPFVRKVAMYWMSRIVKAHMMDSGSNNTEDIDVDKKAEDAVNSPRRRPDGLQSPKRKASKGRKDNLSAASISVRNSVPHVLPGILLSIGDNFQSNQNSTAKDAFLPDQTTRDLAEQTNACLQDAVSRDGMSYVQHLDGFIVALREELDSPGGFSARNPPAVYRTPYRMDMIQDGTGIETGGWFRSSRDTIERNDDAIIMSRLCALHWVIVLYESVVPDPLKADYAREFIFAIIHQLADNPPQTIVYKSLEVLAKITIPVSGEEKPRTLAPHQLSGFGSPTLNPAWKASSVSGTNTEYFEDYSDSPMSDANVAFAMKILGRSRKRLMSRDREVFSSLVQLYSYNEQLLADLSNVLTYMCKLQPPAFVMVSFAVELDRFVRRRQKALSGESKGIDEVPLSSDLKFVSSFIQNMNHVLLNTDETKDLRNLLKDCVAYSKGNSEEERQRSRFFHILLHAFSHNVAATLSLCLWAGAYRTAHLFVNRINPLDINLMFLLEIDRLVEMLERPLFRHLHVRMLERDQHSKEEGSGAMLFQFLKCLLMILPQSTCYRVLRDRLTSISRFRQSTSGLSPPLPFGDHKANKLTVDTKLYVTRVREVRELHCAATWKTIRQGSLEVPKREQEILIDEGADRRKWLGYASKEQEMEASRRYQEEKTRIKSENRIEELKNDYRDLESMAHETPIMKSYVVNDPDNEGSHSQPSGEDSSDREETWKNYWTNAQS